MKSILFILALLCLLGIAFFAGRWLGKRTIKNDGTIYLEKNEDGDDRIRFYLGMEYEDIASHERIVFRVVKQ